MPGSTAAFGLAAQGIGSALVLNMIFWLALLISIPIQGYNPAYGFGALLGVLLLGIFAGLVFLLTRGERQASVFVKRVGDRGVRVDPLQPVFRERQSTKERRCDRHRVNGGADVMNEPRQGERCGSRATSDDVGRFHDQN